jgi:hypothetical protein
MPPLDLYARVRHSSTHGTRDRGCSVHPAFPAPFVFVEGGKFPAGLGRLMPRERGLTFCTVISCDKREAFAQGSEATKQSMPLGRRKDGLLRCARNDGLGLFDN